MELPLRVVLDGAKYSWESHIFRNTGWQIRPQALDSNDMDLDLRCVTLSPLGSLLVSSVRDSEDVAWSHPEEKKMAPGCGGLGQRSRAARAQCGAQRQAHHALREWRPTGCLLGRGAGSFSPESLPAPPPGREDTGTLPQHSQKPLSALFLFLVNSLYLNTVS